MSEDGRSSLPYDQQRERIAKLQERSFSNRFWILIHLYKKELEPESFTYDEQFVKDLSLSKDEVQNELKILRKQRLVDFSVTTGGFHSIELTGTGINLFEKRLPNYEPPLDQENNDAEYNELRLKIIKEENKGKKLDLIIELIKLPSRATQLWNHFFGN